MVTLTSACMDGSLPLAIQQLQSTLAEAAAAGKLGHAASEAFGFLSLPEGFWQLPQDWASKRFVDLPPIQVSAASAMASARAAYVLESGRVCSL